jgi:mono/diheme cytochrome c family protein
MRKSVHTIYFVVFAITCLIATSSPGQSVSERNEITAVSSESWLAHLHRAFDETSMGKTGRLGPPELTGISQKATDPPPAENSETLLLSGSDLYRLNCRGCHGEFGAGAPPEINSVINPVRASSAALVMERMKNAGATMSRAEATKLADQSKAILLQRFHNGGQDMPAFPQLSEADIRVLLGYLKQLADVPGAERERGTVKASSLRVGELIVKSTCHTCHAATGLDPTPQELSDGAIPPLSSLTTRVNRAEFVRKVTQGAPIIMGTPALPYRGRMPVFYYLSETEASDVFSYLLTYPPKAAENSGAAMASQEEGGDAGNDPSVASSLLPNKAVIPASGNLETDDPIILAVAGLLVMFLLAGGAALTVWELRKLAPPARSRQLARNYPPTPLPRIQRDMVA